MDLFPWNDIRASSRRERLLASLVNYTPLALTSLLNSRPSRWPRGAAAALSALFLAGHLAFWWKPYLLGASPSHRASYGRLFARTLKLLPPIRDHPVPDAQHMVVGLLTVAMLASSLAGLRQPR